MFNKNVQKEIIEKYGIDIINDVCLADDYHIAFCYDFNKKENAELMILSGNIEEYGFDRNKPILVKDIISYINLDNPISDIMGREKYIEYMFSIVGGGQPISDIYFPVLKEDKNLWVACSIRTLLVKDESRLIYGKVNWISDEMPDAIKYYNSIYKDDLTGLFTKNALKFHLGNARTSDHSFGLYFDIDNFKRINDIFGHKNGDKYLMQLGEKFKQNSKENVIFYRIGGDEFFVYLLNYTEKEAYKKATQVIYDVERINSQAQQAEVSASVGIVPIIGSEFDIDDLLDLADRTMYHAKQKGKGNISYARDV